MKYFSLMQQLRWALRWVFHVTLKPLVAWSLRGKDIYIFHGIRRSGNHACINWVANALAGEEVELRRLTEGQFNQYCDDILFVDSFVQESAWTTLWRMGVNRRHLKRATKVLLSTEDVPVDLHHFLNVRRAQHIGITRDLASVLASRIKKYDAAKRSHASLFYLNFTVTPEVLGIFREVRRLPKVWHYDAWLQSAAWRREFLRDLGLEVDVMPQMSSQAGGSSFGSSSDADPTAFLNRHTQVPCPPWLPPMVEAVDEALSDEERARFADWAGQR